MTAIIEKKKNLFSASGSADGIPFLKIGTCQCGHTFFPPHEFGCEACGSESVRIRKILATGRLKSSAVAHMHSQDPNKPVVIGEIVLENGPCIIAFLDASNDTTFLDTMLMVGTFWEINKNKYDGCIVELIFATKRGRSRRFS